MLRIRILMQSISHRTGHLFIPGHLGNFRISSYPAFGGEDEQRKRLEEDGVEVKDGKVDLKKYGMRT